MKDSFLCHVCASTEAGSPCKRGYELPFGPELSPAPPHAVYLWYLSFPGINIFLSQPGISKNNPPQCLAPLPPEP